LIFFNFDLIFGKFSIIKKYTSESQTLSIEISIIPAEFLFQITILITESLSRPMTPADQMTIINRIIIMKFPIENSLIIQKMINKFNIQIPSLPIYRATVKNFVDYIAAEALVRDLQIKKLQKAAANKKKRSKKTIKLNIIYSETWEIIQEE
jgi:hypothetical protein